MAPSYGTVDTNQNGTTSRRSDEESQPLLGKDEATSYTTRLRTHMQQDVSRTYGDVLLLLCYVITGLLDSSATVIWGSFVSMQTGNTVYLGLGIANPQGGDRWVKSLLSITFFCFGSLVFSRYHHYFSPRRRWVLVLSYVVQTLLIVVAAVIVTTDTRKEGGLHWHIVVPLALVAFQSSGQAVTSRALKYNALTSVVLTSIYCDLWSDQDLLAAFSANVERNRRVAAPVCLLIGAVLGGIWARSDFGLAGALWSAAGMKSLIVVAWMVWKKAPEDA